MADILLLDTEALNPTRAAYDAMESTTARSFVPSSSNIGLMLQKVVGTDPSTGKKLIAPVFVNALDPIRDAATLASRTALTDAIRSVSVAIAGETATNQSLSDWLQTISGDANTLHADLSGTIHTDLTALLTKLNAGVGVTGTFWPTTQAVSGTFWQTTQPVSLASVPLAPGAATDAILTTKLDVIHNDLVSLLAAQPATAYAYQGSADWGTLALAGSAFTLATVPTGGLGSFRVQAAAGTALLGTLLGGGARVTLYYANTTTGLPTDAGSATLLTGNVAAGGSFDLAISKKAADRAPAGKFLRILSSNGGVSANAYWG